MQNDQKIKGSLPVRISLTNQSANYLRKALADSRWTQTLPSEGELSRELGVSRGTLRSALALLFSEGLLKQGGRGEQHQIICKRPSPPPHKISGKYIRILSPQPRSIVTGQTQIIFQQFTEALNHLDLHVEFEYHKGLRNIKRPDSKLRKITSKSNTAAWILYRSSLATQQWFSNSNIPALVLGGMYPDIKLPHAEFDWAAASRHAAGIFAARGHKRMAIITVEKAAAGDEESDKAFISSARAAGAHVEVVVFDDTVTDLCHKLDSLLMSSSKPTAYYVNFSNHVLATMGHLARRGYSVPESASIISRMNSDSLAESIPTIALYRADNEKLARNMARILSQALQGSTEHCVILPEFIDGDTASRINTA